MKKLSLQKKLGIILAVALIFAAAVPVLAQQNLAGPTVTDDSGQTLAVVREIAGPDAWASARANIPLAANQTLLGVFNITPPDGYTGGGTVMFVANGYTDAQIYHYVGTWAKLPTTFNPSNCHASAYTSSFSPFAIVATSGTAQSAVSGSTTIGSAQSTLSGTSSATAGLTSVLGVSIADSRGTVPGGSATHVLNASTINTTRSALNLSGSQSLSLYDISNLTGATPYTVTFSVPSNATNTAVYMLGSTGVWTKMYDNVANNTATIMITGPSVLAVVNTVNDGSVPGAVNIVLPAGTTYYAIAWVAGMPTPTGTAMTLPQATVAVQGANYPNGYATFKLNGSDYLMATTQQAKPTATATTAPQATATTAPQITVTPAATPAPAKTPVPVGASPVVHKTVTPLPFF